MVIKGKTLSIKRLLCLMMYYLILRYLPVSYSHIGGSISKKLRYLCCKHIFKFCGENVNIERGANFGTGFQLKIGNNSGLGKNCNVPGNIEIGENVMMGPECYILAISHAFDRVDIPMIEQLHIIEKKTVIENDVWIGRQVIFTPGRTVRKGSIIGAGCVLSKDFPSFSIIGGNPSRLIRLRVTNME